MWKPVSEEASVLVFKVSNLIINVIKVFLLVAFSNWHLNPSGNLAYVNYIHLFVLDMCCLQGALSVTGPTPQIALTMDQ